MGTEMPKVFLSRPRPGLTVCHLLTDLFSKPRIFHLRTCREVVFVVFSIVRSFARFVHKLLNIALDTHLPDSGDAAL
jgi:hypothetical protein